MTCPYILHGSMKQDMIAKQVFMLHNGKLMQCYAACGIVELRYSVPLKFYTQKMLLRDIILAMHL